MCPATRAGVNGVNLEETKMSKTKTKPIAAPSYVAPFVREALKIANESAAREIRAAEAAAKALIRFAAALKDHDAINSERWKAFYAAPLREAFKASGKYAADSLAPMLNRYQIAAIGLTNGVAFETGESMEKYVNRIKDTVKAAGHYGPQNAGNKAGGAKGDAKRKGKTKATKAAAAITREAAALALANGDKADAEMLQRMMATAHTIELVRAWFAEAFPTDADDAPAPVAKVAKTKKAA